MVDDIRQLIFIHIPKTGGTTIRQVMGLDPELIQHRTPADLDLDKWDNYYVVCSVRHPIDRFISSWAYHTSADYEGVFGGKVKRGMAIKDYWSAMRDELVMYPQVRFMSRPDSEKTPDYIIRYETFEQDLKQLAIIMGIRSGKIPKLKASKHSHWRSYEIPREIIGYYAEDFEYLKYGMS